MANNRVCLCCGNAYEYCGSCRNGVNLPAWKNLFDNENCKDVFQTVSDYEQKAIDKTKETSGNKGKLLFMPIRIKTTGIMHGPELASTLHLLGKEKVLQRLKG